MGGVPATMFGGEAKLGYTQMLSDSRLEAVELAGFGVRQVGGNAALAMRLTPARSPDIGERVAAYGTARSSVEARSDLTSRPAVDGAAATGHPVLEMRRVR